MSHSAPAGYNTVSPYLVVANVERQIEFLKKVFDAQVKESIPGPEGNVNHAEVIIGDSVVMMGRARGESPKMPGMLYVYVDNCDQIFQRALDVGANAMTEPSDQFYGDRVAGVKDEHDNQWWIATRVEDLSSEEVRQRAQDR